MLVASVVTQVTTAEDSLPGFQKKTNLQVEGHVLNAIHQRLQEFGLRRSGFVGLVKINKQPWRIGNEMQ
tara:strand:+ start:7066 stop:7272 length:207 start_codon:yes stop_codon:yes gene_type:complete